MTLSHPTPEYVRSRLPSFSEYKDADAALDLVFKTWPMNVELPQVLSKVVTLNRLYSTSVFDVHGIAHQIVELGIDADLNAGNIELVPRIASFTQSNGKHRYFYSFATKYCAWHNPDGFQIYDSRVNESLWHYKKTFRFADFRRYELEDYPKFIQIMDWFLDHFDLREFSRKQIDKFLWIEGQSLF